MNIETKIKTAIAILEEIYNSVARSCKDEAREFRALIFLYELPEGDYPEADAAVYKFTRCGSSI